MRGIEGRRVGAKDSRSAIIIRRLKTILWAVCKEPFVVLDRHLVSLSFIELKSCISLQKRRLEYSIVQHWLKIFKIIEILLELNRT